MSGFGIRIIIVIIVLSGTIAYIGDLLGRFIGKKRLTIFRLRPKYTAISITVIIGILIATSTIAAIVAISNDARTALFGLDELRKTLGDTKADLETTKKELGIKSRERETLIKETEKISNELASSKNEIARLQEVRDKLAKEVAVTRVGQILFRVGDNILTSIVEANGDKAEAEKKLKGILSAAETYIRRLYGKEQKQQAIYISVEDFNKAVEALIKYNGDVIVNVVTSTNVMFGEKIPVQLASRPNNLVYNNGDVIYSSVIDGTQDAPEIEQKIIELLSHVRSQAVLKGIQADIIGSVGTVPYEEIYKTARDIKDMNDLVDVGAFATKDIYAIGPIAIEFRLSYHVKPQ